jgi:hypothetical protein
MSATATATAILKGDEAFSRGDNSVGSGSISTSSSSASPARATSSSTAVMTSASSPASQNSVSAAPKPDRPPISIQTESYASSIFSTESTGQYPTSPYDVLASSPDSEFSREPLLGGAPETLIGPEARRQEVIPSQAE